MYKNTRNKVGSALTYSMVACMSVLFFGNNMQADASLVAAAIEQARALQASLSAKLETLSVAHAKAASKIVPVVTDLPAQVSTNQTAVQAPTQATIQVTTDTKAEPVKKDTAPVWVEPCYIKENKKIMTDLYRGISGFVILSPQEKASIERSYTKKTSIYGEIPYDSLQVILDNEHFGPNDVFYDLGCGVGKVPVQVFLNTPAKKVVGIELSASRFVGTEAMFKKFKTTCAYTNHLSGGKDKRSLEFKKQDFLRASIGDATIIYMCSTCFPPELMEELIAKFKTINRLGLRIITLKELPDHQKHGFRFDRKYDLPMSWSKAGRTSPVYVYTYAGNLFS